MTAQSNTTPPPLPTPVPIPVPAPAGPISAAAASNSQQALQAFLEASKDFGTKAGGGDVSRYGWLMCVGEASYRKEIEKKDIGPGYDAFHEGRKNASAAQPSMSRGGKTNNGKDRAARISEATTVWFVAQLPDIDGLKALGSINGVIKSNPQLKGETAALLVKGCRVQKKSPQAIVPKEDMLFALQPTEKDEKSEADMLEAVAKTIENVVNKTGEWTPHTRGAHNALMQRIAELGGTTRQQVAAAKKKAEDQAKAAKKKKK